MREYVFKIHKRDADALGAVRCVSGLRVAEDQDLIWIRGLYDSSDLDIRMKQLPVKNTFTIDTQDNLFLSGGLTPIDRLKKMLWQPLTSFIKPELPGSVLPGRANSKVQIKLKLSNDVKPASALLTQLAIWKTYAETAPASRLNFLHFAVSEKNDALIIGSPLPPLPGLEYWLSEDILLPAGYHFEISIVATLIRKQFNENADSLIMFDKEGRFQKMDKNLFVPAKRSAVRLTKGN